MAKVLQNIRLAVVLSVALLLLYGGLNLAFGTLPAESELSHATGILTQAKASLSSQPSSFEFKIADANGQTREFNMPFYGKPGLEAGLVRALKNEVSVSYQALLLGNRAIAVSAKDAPILTYTEAAAFIEQKRPAERQIGYVILGALAVMAMLVAANVMINRSPNSATRSGAGFRFGQYVAGVGLPVLITGALAQEFFHRPQSLRPMEGVFGPSPLGIPSPVFSTMIVALAMSPCGYMLWHLIGARAAAVAAGGQNTATHGIIGTLLFAARNWHVPGVRSAMLNALAGFLVLMAVLAAWIIATSRAGV